MSDQSGSCRSRSGERIELTHLFSVIMPMHASPLFRRKPRVNLIRLVLFLFVQSLLTPSGYADSFALPEIGDPSGNLLSHSGEVRLGKAFIRSVRSSQPVNADPLLNDYIQSLGDRLAKNSDNPGRVFHFFLLDDAQVNAFAGPGGYIGVNTGLITTTESESELASVLSHEIAHITQNHLVRTFDALQRLSLPAAAIALTALLIGAATKQADAGLAIATGVQAGMAQSQINFTRAHEEEADSLGIQILAKAGFDPQAMPTFFDRMGQATRLYSSGELPELLRTHPVTSNRIADARGRAGDYPYRQSPDSLEYHLIRSALKYAQFNSSREAVTYFRENLINNRYRSEEGTRYGYTLALIADRQFKEARKQLDLLLRKRPEQIAYIDAEALLLEKTGKRREAQQVIQDALELYPGNLVLSMRNAILLLDIGSAQQALTLLETQLQGRPEDERLYHLAARAAGDAGKTSLAHQYMAEYYYLSGELESAVQQLQIALQDKSIDYYRSARLTARLRMLEDESNELKRRNE